MTRHEQRSAEGLLNAPYAGEWHRIGYVIGDQQNFGSLYLQLRGRLEQSHGKAPVKSAKAGGGMLRVRRDSPIAGWCVMHRIVEARGRNLPVGSGKRDADVVDDIAIIARRHEYCCDGIGR